MDFLLNQLEGFFLIFVRMTGLFVIAPIFGRRNMPTYFKVGFSFLLALLLASSNGVPATDESIYAYTLSLIKEFFVGIIIGYVAYLIFTGVYIAGQIIDMQIGFGMINVIDPLNSTSVPVTSNLYNIICMLIFLMVDGHHLLITALYESYKVIPAGGMVISDDLLKDIIRLMGSVFLIALKICAPVVASILISDVALGVIMKSVPHFNIFVVGLPLKLLLGMVIMWATIPMFIIIVDMIINGLKAETPVIMRHLSP